MKKILIKIIKNINQEFKKIRINKNLSIQFLFIFVIFSNLYGIFPFFFSFTSHFYCRIRISISFYISSLYIKINKNLSSFLNSSISILKNKWNSSPWSFILSNILNSIIKLIVYSIHIITISFRLSINISAGHIIIGVYSSSIIFLLCFLFYEIFACIIQSVIFFLIGNLYHT